jgi:DNA-binding NarL/FixJ family response regulator
MSDSPEAVHEEMPAEASVETKMNLPPRLAAVASGIVNGKSNKEIAAEMQISTNGVKQHVNRLFEMLHVNNRTLAAIRLFTAGVRCA